MIGNALATEWYGSPGGEGPSRPRVMVAAATFLPVVLAQALILWRAFQIRFPDDWLVLDFDAQQVLTVDLSNPGQTEAVPVCGFDKFKVLRLTRRFKNDKPIGSFLELRCGSAPDIPLGESGSATEEEFQKYAGDLSQCLGLSVEEIRQDLKE